MILNTIKEISIDGGCLSLKNHQGKETGQLHLQFGAAIHNFKRETFVRAEMDTGIGCVRDNSKLILPIFVGLKLFP